MFRSPQAEQTLSADNYARLVHAVLGEELKQGYFTDEDHKAYLETWSQPGALTGGLNYYRAARIGPPTSEGSHTTGNYAADVSSLTVQVPTLVIWGEQDPYLLTGNLEGLEVFVPNITIKPIPAGSHWVIHEQPALVNAYMRDFIAGKPLNDGAAGPSPARTPPDHALYPALEPVQQGSGYRHRMDPGRFAPPRIHRGGHGGLAQDDIGCVAPSPSPSPGGRGNY